MTAVAAMAIFFLINNAHGIELYSLGLDLVLLIHI
jgi:hypothetical protein